MALNDGQGGDVFWTALAAYFSDSDYDYVRMDASTHALETMGYEHHEIHSGSHYFVGGFTELQSAGTTTFWVTTPNTTEWAHMTFAIEAQALITMQVFEGATYGGGGTAVTPINNNRNSSNTSSLTIVSNGTASALGTQIDAFKVGGATVAAKPEAVGESTRDKEVILKQNTTYRYLITSGANSNTVTYHAEWYEHTHKD